MPPNDDGRGPSNAELDRRLKLLEEGKIAVKNLPMIALQKALARTPQNPVDTLLPHSIGPALVSNKVLTLSLGTGLKLVFGNYECEWGGALVFSNIVKIKPGGKIFKAWSNCQAPGVVAWGTCRFSAGAEEMETYGCVGGTVAPGAGTKGTFEWYALVETAG